MRPFPAGPVPSGRARRCVGVLGTGVHRGPLLALVWVSWVLLAVAPTTRAGEPPAPAERLGPTWPIVEEDLRTTLRTRLQASAPRLGERLRATLARFRWPGTSRPTAESARTLLLDPTLTTRRPLTTREDRTIVTEGEPVNPLALVSLRRTYLVLDGRDARQVAWASTEVARGQPGLTTVLLTEGSLDEARAALPAATPVFPAPAVLFTRFPVDSVPARLAREGPRLRLDLIAQQELGSEPEGLAGEEAPVRQPIDVNRAPDR